MSAEVCEAAMARALWSVRSACMMCTLVILSLESLESTVDLERARPMMVLTGLALRVLRNSYCEFWVSGFSSEGGWFDGGGYTKTSGGACNDIGWHIEQMLLMRSTIWQRSI